MDFPVNRVEELSIALATAEDEFTRICADIKATAAARFTERGGCSACAGRGWVVVWDTMDSMSGCYAEYGPCPRSPEGAKPEDDWWQKNHGEHASTCTAESRIRSGFSPRNTKYDKNRGTLWSPAGEDRKLVDEFNVKLGDLRAALNDEAQKWELQPGVLAQVIKAPRAHRPPVPYDTYVTVLREDYKTLVRTPSGETHWIKAKQLRTVHSAPTPEMLTELGFVLELGVPFLGVFQCVSGSGKAIKVTSVLDGKDDWFPLSAVLSVRIDTEAPCYTAGLGAVTTLERLRNLSSGSGIMLRLDDWFAKKIGLVQS
jgi:hypothetical protein